MSLPNIDLQPDVRSNLMAQIIVRQQRDKEIDQAYEYSSRKAPGMHRTFKNVETNYDTYNRDRNNAATAHIANILEKNPSFAKKAFNGGFTEAELEHHLLTLPGYDPSLHLSRFFPHKAETKKKNP